MAMSSDSDDWDVPEEGTFRRVDTEAIVAAEAAAEADAAARAAEADEKRALEAVEIARDAERARERERRDSEPVVLVDITALDPTVHNRHDKNAVNDVDKASKWRRTIEADFRKYSSDATLVANGTVRACSRGVYLPALQQLREDVPGHYWVAVFPPASS